MYEEGQSENAGQLGEEQSELWNKNKRGGDSVVPSFFVKIMEGRNTATKLHKNDRSLHIARNFINVSFTFEKQLSFLSVGEVHHPRLIMSVVCLYLRPVIN